MGKKELLHNVSKGLEFLSISYASLVDSFNKDSIKTLEETINSPQESTIVEEFLNGSNNNFTKLVAAAMKIAEQKGVLPLKDTSSIGIASLADEACQQVKAAYCVGVGKLDSVEAIDMLADRATSRAVVICELAIDKGINIGIDVLGAAYPSVIAYKPIIKSIVAVAKPTIKSAIIKGVKSITNFVSSKLSTLLKVTSNKNINKESRLYN